MTEEEKERKSGREFEREWARERGEEEERKRGREEDRKRERSAAWRKKEKRSTKKTEKKTHQGSMGWHAAEDDWPVAPNVVRPGPQGLGVEAAHPETQYWPPGHQLSDGSLFL